MQNKLNFFKKEQPKSTNKRASKDALFSRNAINTLSRREIVGIAMDKLLLLVVLASICLFVLYPLLCIARRSMLAEDGGWTLGFYGEAWQKYAQTLWNSVFVATLSAILCTVFSVATALVVSSSKGWVRILGMAIILITMVSPPFVGSLAYIQLYGKRGWITYGLLGLRWNPYNKWGVILMQSISFVPMNALFLNGILTKIDSDSIKAARE